MHHALPSCYRTRYRRARFVTRCIDTVHATFELALCAAFALAVVLGSVAIGLLG